MSATILPFPHSAITRRVAPRGAVSVPLYVAAGVKVEQFARALASAGLLIAYERATQCFVIREAQIPQPSPHVEGDDHG